MQINNYLREALAISSNVCYTDHIYIGQIGACASGRDWNHSVLYAQGGQQLSGTTYVYLEYLEYLDYLGLMILAGWLAQCESTII